MKIAISAGHNIYANGYFDNGTRGHGKTEAAEVKKTVALAIKGLRAKGHEVLDVTPYNQRFYDNYKGSAQRNAHSERGQRVTRFKPDLYLDIHLNAGGGTGPETIVYSTTTPAYPWARKITNSIAKETGLTNRRGVKVRPGMWSVSLQTAPSIIVEGAFMDTKRDMDRITPEKYAAAIVSVFPNIAKVQPEEEKQMVNKKTVKTRINGIEKTVEGILEEGSNYIPVRFLEEIGYDVSWEQSTNTVVIESGTDIKLKIDGENKIVSGIFENNTNFIPVRFLEEVGYEVSWDNDTRTVIVSSK